jgi:carbon monoxide dehydrogenase subunit G
VSPLVRRLLIGTVAVAAVLASSAALFYVLQPSSFRVARTRVIAAPPSAIRAQLEDLRTFVELGPWLTPEDPSTSFTFSAVTRGPGASVVSRDASGTSRITLVSASDTRIELATEREGASTEDAHLRFELRPSGDGTEVTCSFEAEMFGMARALWPFVDLDARLGAPMAAALGRLEASVR